LQVPGCSAAYPRPCVRNVRVLHFLILLFVISCNDQKSNNVLRFIVISFQLFHYKHWANSLCFFSGRRVLTTLIWVKEVGHQSYHQATCMCILCFTISFKGKCRGASIAYLCSAEPAKRSSYAPCSMGSQRFTCHPHVLYT
jgi:hypothetical protein